MAKYNWKIQSKKNKVPLPIWRSGYIRILDSTIYDATANPEILTPDHITRITDQIITSNGMPLTMTVNPNVMLNFVAESSNVYPQI